jgi:PAS domain S-box-containing protein
MFDTSKFFDNIFNNSSHNGIIIMDADGIVQQVNEAFSTAYGYRNEDLQSKHFRVLYTEKDQTILKPEIELNMTHRQGNHTDENYLVHKDRTPIWVTGRLFL